MTLPPLDRDLSVIIPTRNRSRQLQVCLDALAVQSLSPDRFEVVIVDNGSEDPTYEAACRAAKIMPFRITAVVEPRPGPAAARNRGIGQSGGRRILFLGDDILASPGLLAEHLEAAARSTDRAVLGFTDWAPRLTVTPFMRYIAPERGPQFRYDTIADPLDCGYPFFYTSNISLARHWFDVELFDERFAHAVLEDTDLGYRLQKRGLRIAFHRPALAYHDHKIRFYDFVRRMQQAGESNVLFYHKYPELRSDPNVIPSDGYRALNTRYRRLQFALAAYFIDRLDQWEIQFPRRYYDRVLEYYFVRSYFEAFDRSAFADK
jgi:glycosyltransferase involved in cell wall biosynthesis